MASNGISCVETSLNVTVLLPFPLHLTVDVVTERDRLPRCHTDASSKYHVYSNRPVEFEAFLPISVNVTFEWKVVENSTGRVDDEVTVSGVPCYHGQSCTSSIQVSSLFRVLQSLVKLFSYLFSVLTLLAERQEQHPAIGTPAPLIPEVHCPEIWPHLE